MFNLQSITACNTSRVAADTLVPMHESTERLYLAAKDLAGTEGQSAVARLLNMAPQRVHNWETRGVSLDGAIAAERAFGASPVWILEGIGDMARSAPVLVAHEPAPTALLPVSLQRALPIVLAAVAKLNAIQLATVTATLERLRGHPEWIGDAVEELLPKLETAIVSARVANIH